MRPEYGTDGWKEIEKMCKRKIVFDEQITDILVGKPCRSHREMGNEEQIIDK